MAYLVRFKKIDLLNLAYEMNVEASSGDRIADICDKIKSAPNYDEEIFKACLEQLKSEREQEAAETRAEKEADRAYELERLRLTNAAETTSLGSSRAESYQSKRELKNLMRPFHPEHSEISLYLSLFERQARVAGIEEEEWVSQLIALLPLEISQNLIKEPEEKMSDYQYMKKVLLSRFKMKPEACRIKFTSLQKTTTWKDLVFDLRTYLNHWLEGMEVVNFETLKELLVADQLKRRATPDMKEHFLDIWGEIKDPAELGEKLDSFEAVRKTRKPTLSKFSNDEKRLEKAKANPESLSKPDNKESPPKHLRIGIEETRVSTKGACRCVTIVMPPGICDRIVRRGKEIIPENKLIFWVRMNWIKMFLVRI